MSEDQEVLVRLKLAEAIVAGGGVINMSCPYCYCPPLKTKHGHYCAACGNVEPNLMILFEPKKLEESGK